MRVNLRGVKFDIGWFTRAVLVLRQLGRRMLDVEVSRRHNYEGYLI
jgi:hypothetical protein